LCRLRAFSPLCTAINTDMFEVKSIAYTCCVSPSRNPLTMLFM
jgi:hypothetical protein